MIDLKQVSERLYKILKGFNYSLQMYDDKGNITSDPFESRRFFVSPDQLFVSIWEDKKIKVYIGNAKTIQELKPLLDTLRETAVNYGLGYTLSSFNRKIRPRSFLPMIQREISKADMKESMYGTTKSSYEKVGPTRIIVRHSDNVREGLIGARGRNIRAIFIETKEGERIKYPYNHMNGARAMARHIAYEGSFEDDVGRHIQSLSEELSGLNRVSQHIRRNQKMFIENEEVGNIHESIRKRVKEVKNEVSKFSKKRGYLSAVASVGMAEGNNEDVDTAHLAELMQIPEDDEKMINSLSHIAKLRLVEEEPDDFDDYDAEDEVDVESISSLKKAIDEENPIEALKALGMGSVKYREMDQQSQETLMLLLKAFGPFSPDKQSKVDLLDAVSQLVNGDIKRQASLDKHQQRQPEEFTDRSAKLAWRIGGVAQTLDNPILQNIMSRTKDKLVHRDDPTSESIRQEEAAITTKILGILGESMLEKTFDKVLMESYPPEIKELCDWIDNFEIRNVYEDKTIRPESNWVGMSVNNKQNDEIGEVIDVREGMIRVLWPGGEDSIHENFVLAEDGSFNIDGIDEADIPAGHGEKLWDEVLHKKEKNKKSKNFGTKSPIGSTEVGPHKYFKKECGVEEEMDEGVLDNKRTGYEDVDKEADLTSDEVLPDYLKGKLKGKKKGGKEKNDVVEMWSRLDRAR